MSHSRTEKSPTIIDHGTLGPEWIKWQTDRAMRQCRAQAEADDAAWLTDPDENAFDRAVIRWAWPGLIVATLAVIGAVVWGVWG